MADDPMIEEDFAVIVLLGVTPEGQTDEATIEAKGLDDALDRIREVVTKRGREWHAIMLVHIEEYPKMMEGAAAVSPVFVDGEEGPNPTPMGWGNG